MDWFKWYFVDDRKYKHLSCMYIYIYKLSCVRRWLVHKVASFYAKCFSSVKKLCMLLKKEIAQVSKKTYCDKGIKKPYMQSHVTIFINEHCCRIAISHLSGYSCEVLTSPLFGMGQSGAHAAVLLICLPFPWGLFSRSQASSDCQQRLSLSSEFFFS